MRGTPPTAAFLLVLVAGCLPACSAEDPFARFGDALPPPPDSTLPDGASLGPEIRCEAPVEGFVRFTEDGAERGLTALPPAYATDFTSVCFPSRGGIVASDLDLDGDPDLLFWSPDSFPWTFRNDGGQLTPVDVDADLVGVLDRQEPGAFSAVDLNGDRLPDITVASADLVAVSWNLGGLQFSDFEVLWSELTYPRTCVYTMAWGDADGDGDLDLSLPGGDLLADGDAVWDPTPQIGSPDRLLLNDDGLFERALELHRDGGRSLSILTAFTDRDGDGDQDIIVSTDRNGAGLAPMAFHRNDGNDADGVPDFSDDAPVVGFDLNTHGMGLASADLNGDGTLDYCVSDGVAWVPTLLSHQDGWFEAGLAEGLSVDRPPGVPDQWASEYDGWSLELEDLDNDGLLDMAMASTGDEVPVPDPVWQGLEDGWRERTEDLDMTPHNQTSLLAVDLDGDGWLDLVNFYREVYRNPCGVESWLDVELIGPPGNSHGLGARIEVEAGGRVYLRELHSLRTYIQSDTGFHFGLGEAEHVDRLTLRWPDGLETEATGVPTRRVLTLRHPDAEGP